MNARTGEDVLGVSGKDSILEGLDVIQGSLVEAYLLQTEIKMVVLFDEYLQVRVFIYGFTSLFLFLVSDLLISLNTRNSICFCQNRNFALFPPSYPQ